MSDLGWRADGIARARAAGGIDLEVYRKPGFRSELGVRRATDGGGYATGFSVDVWPEDPAPEEWMRHGRGDRN